MDGVEAELTRSLDPGSFVHLHARSWYSFLRGGSSPEAMVARAAELGQPAVAVTDFMSVSGAVKLQVAARRAGINPVVGAEVMLDGCPLVLLAASNEGYGTLNRLLTRAFEGRQAAEERDDATLTLDALADDNAGLLLLTGGREGKLRGLLERREHASALEWAQELKGLMPGRVFVELSTHRRPGEGRVLQRLGELARTAGLPAVASNDARHATADDWFLYDLLSCVRLGVTVHDRHAERPVNDEAHLKSAAEMRRLVFDPAARANTLAIARECSLDLLPGHITPPGAIVPHGSTPREHLRVLCAAGLQERYRGKDISPAQAQLERELAVIEGLDLSDFFLVVHEVVHFARQRGIRCAGRGSAANSIVAYVL
ncbi:MAG TPA: PHP domain-containing protein, partial [Deinococcales bacterium]|nr:PHP domain-containing protein [Deinococcales bacterium]